MQYYFVVRANSRTLKHDIFRWEGQTDLLTSFGVGTALKKLLLQNSQSKGEVTRKVNNPQLVALQGQYLKQSYIKKR